MNGRDLMIRLHAVAHSSFPLFEEIPSWSVKYRCKVCGCAKCTADCCRDYGSGHATWYRINPRYILRLRPQQRGVTEAVRPVTIIMCHWCNSGIRCSRHTTLSAMHLSKSEVDIQYAMV
jgi:hypothetical protein